MIENRLCKKGGFYMRLRKMVIVTLLAAMGTVSLAGCGTSTTPTTETATEVVTEAEGNDGASDNTSDSTADDTVVNSDTVAYKLLAEFKAGAENATDVDTFADQLSKSDVFTDIGMGTMAVEEGLLNGFDEEINGFTKGVMFAPMIGSMPFVAYVFETDDPDTLMDNLKNHYQLNWNICTTADEMVVEKAGNYVFFVMAPYSFDE